MDAQALEQRLFNFAVGVAKLVNGLAQNASGRHIGGQLLRSGTSAAANYQEACAAESRADFAHKLQIVLKELRESSFWLRLLAELDLNDNSQSQLLVKESLELCAIIGKSVATVKGINKKLPDSQ